MMGPHRSRRLPSRRHLFMIAAVAALLAAWTGATAWAAGPTVVVGPGGEVAGEGYPYWLGVGDQIFFDTGGSAPACQTLHAHGRPVEYLNGTDTAQRFRCTASAGEPIYVHGIAYECSTLPGDHAGFGTSASQLKRCARHGFQGNRGAVWVDGAPVTDYPELLAAAPVVAARLPKHNGFRLAPQRLRSADYGEGLLLRGLPAGTHRIVVKSFSTDGDQARTFVVHVS